MTDARLTVVSDARPSFSLLIGAMDDAAAARLAGHLAHILDALTTLRALHADPSLPPERRRAAAAALGEIEEVVASLEAGLGVGRDDWPTWLGSWPTNRELWSALRATST